jgi:hypothetical protein
MMTDGAVLSVISVFFDLEYIQLSNNRLLLTMLEEALLLSFKGGTRNIFIQFTDTYPI